MDYRTSTISKKRKERLTAISATGLRTFLLASALVLAAGCDDDDATVAELTVVRAELNFGPTADRGFAVMSDAGCTAQLSESWCRTEQKGDSIFVYVEDNTALEGRTAVLTVTGNNGNGVQQIPVSQRGAYFRTESETDLHANDASCTLSVPVSAVYDYQVELPEQTWITYTRTDEGVDFHLTENSSGLPRKVTARFTCAAMGLERSITFSQYELKDLMGTWTATYRTATGSETETSSVVNLSLTDDKQVELTGLTAIGNLPLTLKGEADGYTYLFRTGTRLDDILPGMHLYMYGINENGKIYGKETEEHERTYTARLAFTEDDGLECTFEPDSTFSDKTEMKGLALSVYDDADKNQGDAGIFINLKLSK